MTNHAAPRHRPGSIRDAQHRRRLHRPGAGEGPVVPPRARPPTSRGSRSSPARSSSPGCACTSWTPRSARASSRSAPTCPSPPASTSTVMSGPNAPLWRLPCLRAGGRPLPLRRWPPRPARLPRRADLRCPPRPVRRISLHRVPGHLRPPPPPAQGPARTRAQEPPLPPDALGCQNHPGPDQVSGSPGLPWLGRTAIAATC